MPSPAVEIRDGAGSFTSATNGKNVTPGNTVTIRLVSSAGVGPWLCEVISTDDLSDKDTINAGIVIDSNAYTATFTAPASGRALRFRSMVNSGLGSGGTKDKTLSTTFGIYTLTSGGERVLAVDETFESDSVFGWTARVNATIRNGSTTGLVSTTDGGTGQDLSAATGLLQVVAGVVTASDALTRATTSTSANSKAVSTDANPPATTTTSGAVTATLDSFTLASNTQVTVSWMVGAVKSDLSQGASYTVTASFRNNAGTVSQIGSTSVAVIGEDDSAWNATADNSTTTIRLRVTGNTGDDITWGSVMTKLALIP